ncbi:TPA: hypothetical protein DDW35_11965 [Candidatus Sumerlaeota bacterium]|jgi:ribonuclease HI|nr:hypothetical protein [Candidatus Sumerlaeota bacterium]
MPDAKSLKKDTLELSKILPPDAPLDRLLTTLANHDAAVRMLTSVYPSTHEADIRKALSQLATLTRSLNEWATAKPAAKSAPEELTTENADVPAMLSFPDRVVFGYPGAIGKCKRVKVFVDGASKGNPGPAYAGVQITTIEGEPVYEAGLALGEMTNNAAEYHGMLHALEMLTENGCPEAYFFSDSMLMVNQMNGEWQVKHPGIMPLIQRAQVLRKKLSRFQIVHVRRENNRRADELANLACKKKLVKK